MAPWLMFTRADTLSSPEDHLVNWSYLDFWPKTPHVLRLKKRKELLNLSLFVCETFLVVIFKAEGIFFRECSRRGGDSSIEEEIFVQYLGVTAGIESATEPCIAGAFITTVFTVIMA